MSHTVLFVCTGNLCRSPMAAALFNSRAEQLGESALFVARSAGTWASDNQPASSLALKAMAERGIDMSYHRAHTLTHKDLAEADVIVVMTRNHREALMAEFREARSKLHLMSELRGRVFDISDPYGASLTEYLNCARELAELVDNGYAQIKTWAASNKH